MATAQNTESTPNEDCNRSFEIVLDLLKNVTIETNIGKKIKEKDNIKIPDWLEDFESPFLWHSEEKRGLGLDMVIQNTTAKLEDLRIEEPGFSIQRFTSMLKLILEFYIIEDLEKSWEIMKTVEDLLESETTTNDPLYQKVKLSLGHVVSATKAYLLAFDGEEEQSKRIAKYIIPLKIMADHERAGLCSMKARFFLYSGYENGEDTGVKYAREALELDPLNAEWEYQLAKILRQQRKEVPFSMDIPREELVLLESAVKRCKNSKYLVYLAQVYRECGSQAFKQYKSRPGFFNSELHHTIDNMTVKALTFYKEALEMSPESPAVLRRVGYGIMYLPKKVAEYDLALKCLLKSLELSENQMTLHVLGMFYNRYGNDNKKALEYFEKTVERQSVVGLCDAVRVKYIMDPQYNPCQDLEAALQWGMKKNKKTQILVHLGGFFLLVKRDLQKSIQYFSQVITEDRDSPVMKTHKSLFLRMYDGIDLYTYITNESLLLLQNNILEAHQNEGSSLDKTANTLVNVGQIEEILDKISEMNPQLMEMVPDPSLIDKLHDTSKEIKNRESGKTSRHGSRGSHKPNHRGRGGKGDFYSRRGGEEGSGRGPSAEDAERRGRFSIANQRVRNKSSDSSEDRVQFSQSDQDHSDNFERRERLSHRGRDAYHSRRGSNFKKDNNEKYRSNQHENWREK